jgi:hypothetical protein
MFPQTNHTPASAIIHLHSRGFEYDFQLQEQGLYCVQSHSHFLKKDYTIEECYHFPASGLNDSLAIIYGIHCTKQRMKGILLCRLTGSEAALYWKSYRNYLLPVQDVRKRSDRKDLLLQ